MPCQMIGIMIINDKLFNLKFAITVAKIELILANYLQNLKVKKEHMESKYILIHK